MLIVNNRITDQPTIDLDNGFFFGQGLFETILVKKGKPIFLKEHLSRLNNGLSFLKINQFIEMKDVINQIKAFGNKDYGLKITVSEKNVLLSRREINYKKQDYKIGMGLYLSPLKRNPDSHSTYLKSLNYIDNLIEKQRALDAGYQEALFLNIENFISEGSMTNIFFIKNNQLLTPSIDCGLLNGILRSWIINHYNVIEGKYTFSELVNSDGIFITNSLMGIMKVSRVGESIIKDHDLIIQLQNDYNRLLEVHSNESEN